MSLPRKSTDIVYETSRLKPRHRRTRTELGALDHELYQIVRDHRPITVRGGFYQAEVKALVSEAIARHADPVAIARLKLIEAHEKEILAHLDIDALGSKGADPA